MHAVIYDAVWIHSSVDLQQCEGTECQSWVTDISVRAVEAECFHTNSCAINAGRKHLFK